MIYTLFVAIYYPICLLLYYEWNFDYSDEILTALLHCFCSYGEIAAICKSSNVLLIPDLNTSQSSDILGYAAQFDVPVFSSSSKMLGKIVRKFRLGYVKDDVTPFGILSFLESYSQNDPMLIDGKSYLRINRVESFLDTLLKE